nr:hypothetical protein [bacterium]
GVTIPENTDREEEPGYDGGYVDCSASNIHSQIGSALNGFQALVWEDYIAISNYLATVRAYGDPDPDWGGCGEALGELCDDASVFQMGYQYPFFPSLRMHMDMPYDPVTCEDVNALIGDIVAWYGSCGWILDGLPEVYWSTSFEPDDRKSPAVGESYPQWREEECETSGESPAGSGYAPDTLDTRVIGGGEEPSSER